jgi:hypothetical protein
LGSSTQIFSVSDFPLVGWLFLSFSLLFSTDVDILTYLSEF